MTNSTLAFNTAKNEGGAIRNIGGEVTINNSQIAENQATNCGPNSAGGGIWNSGTLTTTLTSITENSASNGGGIYNTGTLILDEATIDGNIPCATLVGKGGGVFNTFQALATNSTFIDNRTNRLGGGVFNESNSKMTISESTFTQNSAWGGNFK